MGMRRHTASALDRRVQFRRAVAEPDAFGGESLEWQDHGEEISALREDVRDTESVHAGAFRSKLMARFSVRSTTFTRGITTNDRLICEGREFEIVGIKEPQVGRRQLIEITGESLFHD